MSLTVLSFFARRVQAMNKMDVNECTHNDLDRAKVTPVAAAGSVGRRL